MKKLALGLLAATLLFTACGKDEDENQSPPNSFTINDQEVITRYGYLVDWNQDGSQLIFTDKDISVEGFSGNASAIGIDLDKIVSGQTYTFKSTDSASYDGTKNFSTAQVYHNQPFANGEFTDAAKGLDSLTGGSVTVRIVEGYYSVVYDLKYANTTVKGEFNDVLILLK
ncbi:hypothetical protein [Chitinophaga rhizophila]|uniref:Lipoprotein n=1 Tax=Chitinophaga rhizophila TaxID=2866212 RepID=A0ABS7G843_9BACT|nr:hypothetical protein [Chitinophaga rhizophila]MBW8683831.1 hypothetical protein [Chitinophaga rhizophila]